LEMVFSLPILLFVMALMVNYGTVASWKIRGLSASRHVLWGSRWPRNGNTNPRPDYWPATASLECCAAGDIPELDDPRVDHPVVRGPVPGGTVVNDELLDFSRGLRQGIARIERRFPMLGRMGEYELTATTTLLDDKWQFQRMGLWSTRVRRIPVIYALAKAPPALVSAYVAAVQAIVNAPFQDDLRPLDRDDEWIGYGIRFGWGGTAPDFYPRLRRFCAVSHEVARERVDDLIDRIQGRVQREAEGNVTRRIPSVAQTMAGRFIGLYRRVIRQLEALLGGSPPPSPGQGVSIQAEIDELETKIETLYQFLESLRNNDG